MVSSGITRLLRSYSAVVLVVCLGGALSLGGAAWQHHNHQHFIEDILRQRAVHEAARLQEEIARAQEVLASIPRLFAASATVGRTEFRAFTAGALEAHPEYQALEWLPRVPDSERAAFEARLDRVLADRMFTQRNEQGKLVTAGRRAEYFPVLFAEPFEHNMAILGFDAASRPEALEVMAHARDSGRMASTSSITLIQGNARKRAVLLYVPVYRNGQAGGSVAARRANLAGYAVGVLLYGELLEKGLSGSIPTGLDWLLLDPTAPPTDKLLYFHPSRTRGQVVPPVPDAADVRAGLHHEVAIELPGREWHLLFRPAPAFNAEFTSYGHWFILLTGLVLTGLLAAHIARRVRHGHELRTLAEQLGASESRYRTLVTSSPVVIYSCRAEGDFGATYVSPNVLAQMKLRPEQFTANSSFWTERIHPDDRPRVLQELRTLFEHGSHEHEYRFMFGDGTYHWMHDRLTLRRDASGNPVDIVGAWLDVSARKQVEEALLRSEREWRDAMDSFGDILYVLDTKRHLVRANRAFFDLVGSQPGALLGRHIAGILHPQGEAVPCPVCQAQEDLRDAIITMEAGHPDNPSGRPLEITVKILRNETQEALGILMSLHDLTHERQARARLAESEAKYQVLFETMGQGIVYQDRQGHITDANPAAERILGLSLDQMQGRTSIDPRWRAIHEDGSDFPGDTHPSMVALRTGRPVESMTMGVFHPQKNEHRWILISATPQWREGESEPYQVYSTFTDITERKQIERALRESEERLRLALAAANQGFYDLDLRTGETVVNPEYARMLGYEPEEFNETNATWRERLHPDDQGPVYKTYEDYVSGRIPEYRVEFRQRTKSGEWKWILSMGKIEERDENGRPLRMLGTHTDITARKEAEEDQRIAAVTFQSQEAIMITDADANIIRVNQAFEEITGYRAEEVIGRNPRIMQSGRHDAAFYEAMWASLRETGQWSGELWDRRKNGEIYPKFITITAVRDNEGRLSNYVAAFTDISQRKQTEEEIHQLAFFDPLTQLPNRRLFLDRLHQAMAGSQRGRHHGALLVLDLDHFKTINDTLGHAVGDLLLVEVAHRLRAAVREGDTVARLGGDEFVVVLDGLDNLPKEAASQVEQVAEKIRVALAQPYRLREHEHHGTSSIGIALFLGHVETEADLLKHADVALYQAKAAGRNAIRFYDPQMQAALDKRAALEADLRHALGKEEFLLHFQAQVDSQGHPLGAEVLLRWKHPERGFVYPDQFIPVAEESGLIVPIGLWVLETACAQLVAWEADPLTRDLALAVNVSARQFNQAGFVAQVQRVLQATGVNPARLKLELTESAVLDHLEDAIGKMRALQKQGVAFSLDDFGTGHSSLSYLKRLTLAEIKIDRSFVRDLATDPNDAAIVNTIIVMSQTLGLNVIAEGVETEAQCDFLDRHGCHVFQGYLFGKPVIIDQFEAGLRVLSR